MAHRIAVNEHFVEVIHTGDVGYGDRLKALEDVHAQGQIGAGLGVLVDFSAAALKPFGNTDADVRERADYMAHAITHPFFEGRRVALVGISERDAGPATASAVIRKVPSRVFESRESAVDWLTSAH